MLAGVVMAATVTRKGQRNRKGQQNYSIVYKGYFKIPEIVLNHPDFIALSGTAMKLLCDLGAQYNGKNNGDLQFTTSIMKSRGWNSESQKHKALKELQEREIIVKTKQGGLSNGPTLYAITWQPIDDCKGKHDLAVTGKPYRKFSEP